MDQFASQLSNVSLYDVKKYVRKAQNAVLNFSEMEAKVREATNNEPWGTPTSTMQLIADSTNNYQQFHEIMPFIYRRFTEKSATEWRQIYKSLQLLDYLVRNGSERVVDYARSHVSVVEMLRHFSYIDSRGVDQGASIRKRSEEIVALLANTDKLRTERKKAKQLNAKTANTGYGSGGFGGSGRKYGGLSSETYRQQARYGGAPTQQVYGDGGGFDGSNHIVTNASGPGAFDDDEFEEYEVNPGAESSSASRPASSKPTTTKAAAAPANNNEDDDDDFADFQTAPTASAPPKSTSANILDLFDSPAPVSNTTTTTSSAAAAPAATASNPGFGSSFTSIPPASPSSAHSTAAQPTKPANIDLFDSLWETSKTSSAAKPAAKPAAPAPAAPTNTQNTNSNNANTGSSAPPAPSSSSEPVDLLSF